MRILHIDCGRNMRGGQWQALRLIEGLRAAGVECLLLTRSAPLARRAGKICEVGSANFLSVVRFARGVDVVHAHDARAHTLAALAGAKKLVVARRVAFPVRSRWKYGRAARFIAVSDYVRRVMVAGGVPEGKISVVYDGTVLLPQAEGEAVIAPFTEGDREKGGELARVAAASAGVKLEFSRDLEADLPRAAMLVYLSYCEGLGSAALLAMSAGVPVIASDTGGLPEIVRHEKTGLLVPNDAEAIAAAIQRLRDDRALAARLGNAGREMVREMFSTETMVRNTLEVYRQVLA